MRPIDADRLKARLSAQYNYRNRTPIVESFLSMFLELIDTEPTIPPPPNELLTLEELREMDREPVWNDTVKKWVLVDLCCEYGERTVNVEGKWRGLDDRYYRRRPEEGTT